jgi:hypothetical protein
MLGRNRGPQGGVENSSGDIEQFNIDNMYKRRIVDKIK